MFHHKEETDYPSLAQILQKLEWILATGNLARDGLIKVVSVYWRYLYLVLPIPVLVHLYV